MFVCMCTDLLSVCCLLLTTHNEHIGMLFQRADCFLMHVSKFSFAHGATMRGRSCHGVASCRDIPDQT